jgi:hypothetical protein
MYSNSVACVLSAGRSRGKHAWLVFGLFARISNSRFYGCQYEYLWTSHIPVEWFGGFMISCFKAVLTTRCYNMLLFKYTCSYCMAIFLAGCGTDLASSKYTLYLNQFTFYA